MRRHPLLLTCLLAALLTGACLSPRTRGQAPVLPGPESANNSSGPGASALGSGDVLEVRVFQEPDLSGVWRVGPDGTVDYPLCGKVALGGLEPGAAADALKRCLHDGYLRSPQVSVLVKEYNSKKVFVFGEVQKPGTFPFEANMSIVQAITLAGGFSKTAAKNNTNVTRLVDGQEQKLRVPVEEIAIGQTKNFLLQPGDIVFVPQSFF